MAFKNRKGPGGSPFCRQMDQSANASFQPFTYHIISLLVFRSLTIEDKYLASTKEYLVVKSDIFF